LDHVAQAMTFEVYSDAIRNVWLDAEGGCVIRLPSTWTPPAPLNEHRVGTRNDCWS
jgi:hypothetical protein